MKEEKTNLCKVSKKIIIDLSNDLMKGFREIVVNVFGDFNKR